MRSDGDLTEAPVVLRMRVFGPNGRAVETIQLLIDIQRASVSAGRQIPEFKTLGTLRQILTAHQASLVILAARGHVYIGERARRTVSSMIRRSGRRLASAPVHSGRVVVCVRIAAQIVLEITEFRRGTHARHRRKVVYGNVAQYSPLADHALKSDLPGHVAEYGLASLVPFAGGRAGLLPDESAIKSGRHGRLELVQVDVQRVNIGAIHQMPKREANLLIGERLHGRHKTSAVIRIHRIHGLHDGVRAAATRMVKHGPARYKGLARVASPEKVRRHVLVVVAEVIVKIAVQTLVYD